MATKTMLRQLISKWGIMSIEMQKAIECDMGVIGEDGNIDYVDNAAPEAEAPIIESDPATGEVVPPSAPADDPTANFFEQ